MALWCENHLVLATEPAGQNHSERVLELVAEVLGRSRLELGACSAVAFGSGPGSFTGLRIACAVAQGLAWGANLPVVPVGTLAAMSEQCRLEHAEPLASGSRVLCAQDARMDEVYWSLSEWDGEAWVEHVPASLSSPADIAALVGPDVAVGCGNGFLRFARDLMPLVGRAGPPLYPDARFVAMLGRDFLAAGRGLPADQARPLYVRDRVALTSAERLAALEQGA